MSVITSSQMIFEALLFCLGSITYSLLSLLPNFAKNKETSETDYSSASVLFLAECAKLALNFVLLVVDEWKVAGREINKSGKERTIFSVTASVWWRFCSWSSVSTFVMFLIPAVLYAANNNMDVMMASQMDPATQQVLIQNKILATGVLWWLVFRQPLEKKQWLSLCLLTCGSAVIAFKGDSSSNSMWISYTGVCYVVFYCLNSAGCSIYCEWIYKTKSTGGAKTESLYLQNICLYVSGALINLAKARFYDLKNDESVVLIMDKNSIADQASLLHGFNIFTYGMVINYAMSGFLLSFVMKYFSNIHKLLMVGASMYISTAVSVVVLSKSISYQFMAGLCLITISLGMYNFTQVMTMFGKKNENVKVEESKKKK